MYTLKDRLLETYLLSHDSYLKSVSRLKEWKYHNIIPGIFSLEKIHFKYQGILS